MKRWHTVRICPIDSVLFRDGRPFGVELGAQAAFSLPIPTPGTLAGFLRTLVGNLKGTDWEAVRNGYSEERVKGPLMQLDEAFVLPAPADAVVFKDGKVCLLRPYDLPQGHGCNLPYYDCQLKPLMLTCDDERAKPEGGYDFWDWHTLQRWLLDEPVEQVRKISAPPVERRMHVGINDVTLTSEESLLYTVEYRSYEQWDKEHRASGNPPQQWRIVAQVETDLQSVEGIGGLGGERRVAYVEPYSQWLECPDTLKSAFEQAHYVRMYLATPAIFTNGWLPGWLQKQPHDGAHALLGTPPCLSDGTLQLKLVAAAVPRRQVISGWSLKKEGPKPVRWCVPAGAVYFFEVVEGDPTLLAECCWLETVSDGAERNGNPLNGNRNREAGYGLALWGVWKPNVGGAS